MRTWVYKHFDEAGELLYVGISNSPMMRTKQHEESAGWFDQVRNIEINPYQTREEALDAEAQAIIELNPRYNRSVVVNGRVVRVHYQDQLREDYLKIRPLVLEKVGDLGVDGAAKALGISEATTFRMCMSNKSTPMRKTIDKLELHFAKERA